MVVTRGYVLSELGLRVHSRPSISVRLTPVAAPPEVRLSKLLGQFLRQAERNPKPIRCPNRQNAKVVACRLDLKFPHWVRNPQTGIMIGALHRTGCHGRQGH
jgi:hypothetical protein